MLLGACSLVHAKVVVECLEGSLDLLEMGGKGPAPKISFLRVAKGSSERMKIGNPAEGSLHLFLESLESGKLHLSDLPVLGQYR